MASKKTSVASQHTSTGQKTKSLVQVSAKRFKRAAFHKSYSYRYEVGHAAGPADNPLITPGCAIIESRYRGRSASWNVSATVMSTEHYVVNGTFVAPSPENPMTYPPRPADAPDPTIATAPPAPALPRTPTPTPFIPPPAPPLPESTSVEDHTPMWTDTPKRRADPADMPGSLRDPDPALRRRDIGGSPRPRR
jgi:hypothetical protein